MEWDGMEWVGMGREREREGTEGNGTGWDKMGLVKLDVIERNETDRDVLG